MIRATPIKPKPFKVAEFMKTVTAEAQDIGEGMKRHYEATVETWTRKPKFTLTVKVTREKITILVTTKDKIYEYVSLGTKRHWVGPKNKRALKFQAGYSPKTRRGLVGSVPGGASGDFVFSSGHYVGGIKAREFDKSIAKVWRRAFAKRMQGALRRAAYASGHAMR